MEWKIYTNFMEKKDYMSEIRDEHEGVWIFDDEDCRKNNEEVE